MAKNAVHDVFRHEKRQRTYAEAMEYKAITSGNLTQAILDERELHRTFQQALLRLSRQRRIVFVLTKLEGWPRKKIAQALGISECTVKATLQIAIKEVEKATGVVAQRKQKQYIKLCSRDLTHLSIKEARE
jgi:RNA polymerase sigma factor (sigma-70 family)